MSIPFCSYMLVPSHTSWGIIILYNKMVLGHKYFDGLYSFFFLKFMWENACLMSAFCHYHFKLTLYSKLFTTSYYTPYFENDKLPFISIFIICMILFTISLNFHVWIRCIFKSRATEPSVTTDNRSLLDRIV